MIPSMLGPAKQGSLAPRVRRWFSALSLAIVLAGCNDQPTPSGSAPSPSGRAGDANSAKDARARALRLVDAETLTDTDRRWLATAMRGDDAPAAQTAARALARHGAAAGAIDEALTRYASGRRDLGPITWHLLVEAAPRTPAAERAVPVLLGYLADGGPEVQGLMAMALGTFGARLEALLLPRLRDADPVVRRGAVRAVGRLESPADTTWRAVETARREDADTAVRREAERTLAGRQAER